MGMVWVISSRSGRAGLVIAGFKPHEQVLPDVDTNGAREFPHVHRLGRRTSTRISDNVRIESGTIDAEDGTVSSIQILATTRQVHLFGYLDLAVTSQTPELLGMVVVHGLLLDAEHGIRTDEHLFGGLPVDHSVHIAE